MKHMRQVLREVNSFRRVVGFQDAVSDLGTHRICGTDTPYSRQMVYNVLYGRSASKKLIARIVEKRPDLLDLSFVVEATRKIAREMGWRPGMLPVRRGSVEHSSSVKSGKEGREA